MALVRGLTTCEDFRFRRVFVKQKPRLYFDENFPAEVTLHFRSPYWKRRVWVTGASNEEHQGQSDRFHYTHCQKHRYTLVTLDDDFNNDSRYPLIEDPDIGVSSNDVRLFRRLLPRGTESARRLAFI